MTQHTLKKLQDISVKMEILKQQHAKLTSLLEQKIIKILHQEQAFSYDMKTLLGGIQYVIYTMKNTDDASQQICSSWKTMHDRTKPKKAKKSPSQTSTKFAV